MEPADEFTPVDRPLMLSDLNDIRHSVHNIATLQVRWYEESKTLTIRVSKIEKRLWLPAAISVVAAAFAVLARITP